MHLISKRVATLANYQLYSQARCVTAQHLLPVPARTVLFRTSQHLVQPLHTSTRLTMATNGGASSVKLFKSHQYLPEDVRKQSIAALQPRLADAIDLRYQVKTAHWNVKGPSFIALHELFDKISEEADEYIDHIAERIQKLGGVSEGTIKIAAQRSSLSEYPVSISNGKEHVEALSSALAQFGKLIRDTSKKIEENGDGGSVDVLNEIADDVDKWIWFVEAHNQTSS